MNNGSFVAKLIVQRQHATGSYELARVIAVLTHQIRLSNAMTGSWANKADTHHLMVKPHFVR